MFYFQHHSCWWPGYAFKPQNQKKWCCHILYLIVNFSNMCISWLEFWRCNVQSCPVSFMSMTRFLLLNLDVLFDDVQTNIQIIVHRYFASMTFILSFLHSKNPTRCLGYCCLFGQWLNHVIFSRFSYFGILTDAQLFPYLSYPVLDPLFFHCLMLDVDHPLLSQLSRLCCRYSIFFYPGHYSNCI